MHGSPPPAAAYRGYPAANPAGTWVIGGLLVGSVALGGLYLWSRAARKTKAQPTTDVPAVETDDESWRDLIDIDDAMPTLSDFPQGWKKESPYTQGSSDWWLQMRLLELNSPTGSGRDFVYVFSGANKLNERVHGWMPVTMDEFDKQASRDVQALQP